MQTKIENAAKTFFQTKEEYQQFRKHWAENFRETYSWGGNNEHTSGSFSLFDHAIYALLRGRDLRRTFVHGKLAAKLVAGEIKYGETGYKEAKEAFGNSWEAKLESEIRYSSEKRISDRILQKFVGLTPETANLAASEIRKLIG